MSASSIPRGVIYTAIAVFLVTTVVWIIGISNHRFLWREFWIYTVIFVGPAGLVCVSAWLIVAERLWVRALGVLLAVPGTAVWLLSLLLVSGGFKIH